MKRILIIGGGVIGALIVALLILPFLIPGSVYKSQIEKAASSAFGRDVTVAGDVSISVFPGITASVEDVSVANPEGFPKRNMLTAGALRGSVRLMPLFSKRVEIRKIEFVDAAVQLTRLEDGRVNWVLGDGNPEDEASSAPNEGTDVSARIDRISLQNASLLYEDLSAGTRYELTELDAGTAFTSPSDPLVLKAKGKFQTQAFTTDLTLSTPQTFQETSQASVAFEFSSDLGFVSYVGNVQAGDETTLDGVFSGSLPQLNDVAGFLDLDLPINPAPLGALKVDSRVTGPVSGLQFNFSKLSLAGDGFNADYSGLINLDDDVLLDGKSSITIRDAANLAARLGFDLPQMASIQQVTFSSNLSGRALTPSLTGADIRTTSPNLQSSFSGDLAFAGAGRIDGDLKIETSQLRTVLAQFGVAVPEGRTMKVLKVNSRAEGTFQNLNLDKGVYQLDDIRTTGSLGADLGGAIPVIRANLKTNDLSLDPFLGDSKTSSTQQNSGWSDAPLDLQALKLLNADISLQAETIRIGPISLTDNVLKSTLTNGALSTRFEQFSVFGGAWTGLVRVDASPSVPQFGFDLDANSVSAQSLLGTLTGFDRLSGDGGFAINVTTSGSTLDQVVSKMNGTASLNIADGALKGINLGQLVRSAGSLQEQLTSGNLTLASLGQVVSPKAETDFTNFTTQLTISEGVADIRSLQLTNNVLNVSGTGQINLGGRSMDVKLTPAVDRTGRGNASAVQLNGIPIPIRVSGSWVAPKFSPDFSGVQTALQQTVRDRAAGAIAGQLNGELGNIIAGALGEPPTAQSSPVDAGGAPDETIPDEEDEGEEKVPANEDPRERIIQNALGSIFGPN